MKVIQLYKNESKLIKRALKNERDAQHELFSTYAPKMLSVCRQYISDIHFAEDTMITGFYKVFRYLHSFKHQGSFEGWIRKIMVRECISYLRTKKRLTFLEEHAQEAIVSTSPPDNCLEQEEIQQLIDKLPDGYRTVFVMYVIEGYKHEEIAKILQISPGTSKSQLFKARKMIKENYKRQNVERNGTK